MVFCEAGLLDFLERHAFTLTSLELASIGLRYGDMRRFFNWLKFLLKLKTFKVWGHLQAFHNAKEKWLLRPRTFPCDKAWSEVTNEYHRALFLQDLMPRSGPTTWDEIPGTLISEAIEAFVVCQAAWPTRLSPIAPELDSKGYSADDFNRMVINEAWDKLPDGADIMWEAGWEDDVDGYGNETLEHYDSDGYDAHGFNIDGYNQAGIFHSDPSLLLTGNIGRLSLTTMKRRILRRIKDKIPRLDGVQIGA